MQKARVSPGGPGQAAQGSLDGVPGYFQADKIPPGAGLRASGQVLSVAKAYLQLQRGLAAEDPGPAARLDQDGGSDQRGQ